MPVVNQFYPFATAGGAFVLNNAAYLALAARSTGYPAGVLPKESLNSAVRQGSFVAAALSQVLSDQSGLSANDDGVIANYVNVWKVGTRNYAAATRKLTDTGAANAYVVALTPPLTAYVDGTRIEFVAAHANTGASTVNAGPGAVGLRRNDGAATQAADIPLGGLVSAVYDVTLGGFYIEGILVSQVGNASKAKYITSNVQLSPGPPYLVNTNGSPFSADLPANPTLGDKITFTDANAGWLANNFTVGRNGRTIMGFAADLVCSTPDIEFSIWFNGADWRLV